MKTTARTRRRFAIYLYPAAGWRGLDILHFEDGLVKHKLTYAKAKVPLLGE